MSMPGLSSLAVITMFSVECRFFTVFTDIIRSGRNSVKARDGFEQFGIDVAQIHVRHPFFLKVAFFVELAERMGQRPCFCRQNGFSSATTAMSSAKRMMRSWCEMMMTLSWPPGHFTEGFDKHFEAPKIDAAPGSSKIARPSFRHQGRDFDAFELAARQGGIDLAVEVFARAKPDVGQVVKETSSGSSSLREA